jgi:hypothetical protein
MVEDPITSPSAFEGRASAVINNAVLSEIAVADQ